MALRIVLIAVPFCILAILAVIDVFLRRGAGRGWGPAPRSGTGASYRARPGSPSSPRDRRGDTWVA